MVSSSKAERTETKRNEKLSRRARRSSLYLHSVQAEARLAALHAAQRAAGGVFDQEGDNRSVGSESSTRSTDRAIRRGSSRALIDSFERASEARQTSSQQDATTFDGLTSITEEGTTNQSEGMPTKKKKKFRIKSRKSRQSRKGRQRIVSFGSEEGSLKTANGGDAWMCGCCGKVFATYKSAEVHEENCVRDNAVKLGLIEPESPREDKKPVASKSTPNGRPSLRQANNSDLFNDAYSCESWERETDEEPGDQNKNVGFAGEQHGLPNHTPNQQIIPVAAPSILRHSDEPAVATSSLISSSQYGNRRIQTKNAGMDEWSGVEDDLLLPSAIRKYVVLSDEALVSVVLRTTPMTLSPNEVDAEQELKFLAGDKSYYDAMSERAESRKKYRGFARSEGTGVLSKVKNKFVDAYQLVKEGDGEDVMGGDQYTSKKKGASSGGQDIAHTDSTIYVNVIVKNSVRVVDNELVRLAQDRWEDLRESTIIQDEKSAQFERFRKFAHAHAVKLAGLALQSDFTPRRIAVQLSNDLYRLMVPRLKRRGVEIETEIEYRVNAYFVLAANIRSIDWRKLLKYSRKDYELRQKKWREEQSRRDKLREGTTEEGKSDKDDEPAGVNRLLAAFQWLRSLTMVDVTARVLAFLDYLPLVISVPLCWITYHCFLKTQINMFILSTSADKIFAYIEEKGMEMDISVKQSRYQAPFMLAALRELREDSRELKKKRQETESADKGEVLGPLLGPAIKSDKAPATPPPGFEPPENLEYVGLEMDLRVGFKRLRWAILNSESRFMEDAVMAAESKYKDITIQEWSHNDKDIGLPALKDGVNPDDFVGAEKETSYLMPKSAFVNANMAYETNILTEYSDFCFVLKKRCRTPDVPYGSTFIAWTQVVVTNTGNDSCRMVCSVEAEFPNGAPMLAGQIKSGMRSGTAQFFVLLGETICKYADEYP